MKFTINGKEYQLEFGIKFIRKMDEIYTVSANGMAFGMGVESALSYIAMENPTVLYEIVRAGTSHLKNKPSNDDIEDALEKVAGEGKLEKLFKDIQKAMEEAPFLKQKIKNFKKQAKVKQEEE